MLEVFLIPRPGTGTGQRALASCILPPPALSFHGDTVHRSTVRCLGKQCFGAICNEFHSLCQGLPASPALCQDLPPVPPSAPNAEPAPGERGSSSISPAPAPGSAPTAAARSELGRPPSLARGSEPGGAGRGCAPSPPRAPPRAVTAEPSPLAARGAAAPAPPRASPPLPALHPRALQRSGRYAGSSRSSRARGSSTAHRSRSRCRRGPPPYSLPGWRRGQSGRSPRPQPPPPTSGPASAAPAAAAPAQALEPPPRRAFSTPGSRRFPARHAQRARPRCEGARARGLRAGGGRAPPRARGWGRGFRPGRGGPAAGPRPLRPGGPAPPLAPALPACWWAPGP